MHLGKIDGRHLAGFRTHGVGMIPFRHQKSGYGLDRWAPLLDRLRVLNGKRFALAFLQRRRSAVPSLVPFGDERRIRAVLVDVFLNLLVKAGDEGRHQHDDAYTQHNAEHGQRAAKFVCPQGVQRLPQILVIGLGHSLFLTRPRAKLRWDPAWPLAWPERFRKRDPLRSRRRATESPQSTESPLGMKTAPSPRTPTNKQPKFRSSRP